ncbi:hypothetical protein HMPREF9120_00642 [Neisseria sp. oral taxon 020 str. F0370]|nr:hypothetical protein HMPREF9120_00642 [Neisseria sp. oral taxon 020 str. F0370]
MGGCPIKKGRILTQSGRFGLSDGLSRLRPSETAKMHPGA